GGQHPKGIEVSILQGRVVVVTGASSGTGEACAVAFAEKRAKVVLAARRAERLTALVERIASVGGEAVAVATDVTDEAAVQRLFETPVERLGSVDGLRHKPRVADSTAVYEMSLALRQQVIQTNLTSASLRSRAAFGIMKEQRRGR